MLSLIGQNWTHFLWALIATIMMVIIGFFNAAAALRNRGQHTGQRAVHNAGFPYEPD